MESERGLSVTRKRINGLILLAFVAFLVFLVIGAFNESFTRYDPVTLVAPRSGLQMQKGNHVKMRGIDVGKVKDVRLAGDGSGAIIDLNIYPDMIGRIPANAKTELYQLTAFGNKFVNFEDPSGPAASPLRSGSVVTATDVSVEANSLFSTLQRVLDAVQPAQLNTTLGAVSTALQGNGNKIGSTITQTSDYLAKLNRDLPTIQSDARRTTSVAALFNGAAPDLLRAVSNLTQTGRTFVDKKDQFNATLVNLTTLFHTGTDLLDQNGDDLSNALRALRPTTSLLNRYSPMLTCWIQGVDRANQLLEPVLGAGKHPGADTSTFVLPADEPYQNPRDLPLVSAHSGPNCYGLPVIQGNDFSAKVPKDDPTYPIDNPNSFLYTNKNPFAVQFFGPEIFNRPGVAAPAGRNGGR